ncbi:hypothetical protein OMR07_19790 [Methylobacterium organophilum]|nr:hypothetical protein [Methylobacterium organophilum]
MEMRRFSLSRMTCVAPTAFLFVGFGGCASVIPAFDVPYERTGPNTVEPNIDSIIRRIVCELIDTAQAPDDLTALFIAGQDIQVVAELNLATTLEGKAAPTFSFIGQTFNFGTGFSYRQAREQGLVINMSYSLDALRTVRKDPVCSNPADTNLAGNLGLQQMFNKGKAASYLNWSAKGSYGVFGGYVAFTVDAQLLATGPTFTFNTFEFVGPFLTGSNKNVDRLNVAFVRGPRSEGQNAIIRGENFIYQLKQNQIANSLAIIASSR